MEGVSVILGNDLAGGRVWEGVPPPPPIVTSGPMVSSGPDSSEKEFPEVFTACVVTHSMGGAKEPPKQSTVQLTDLPLSLSKSELVAAQQRDPELKPLFGELKSTEEMESLAHGYFLLMDEVLVHKWLPYDDCSVNDPVFQVVLPTKFRDVVLETAHGDVAGHMEVKKTCDCYVISSGRG